MPFVVKGGFGVYPGQRPARIAQTVAQLVQDDERLQAMSRRARQAARPEATVAIARDIAECMLRVPSSPITLLTK